MKLFENRQYLNEGNCHQKKRNRKYMYMYMQIFIFIFFKIKLLLMSFIGVLLEMEKLSQNHPWSRIFSFKFRNLNMLYLKLFLNIRENMKFFQASSIYEKKCNTRIDTRTTY